MNKSGPMHGFILFIYLFIYLLYRGTDLINDWINSADGGR